MIRSKPVELSVLIEEQSSLQKSIIRRFDSRHQISRIKGNLLYFSEVVLRHLVENNFTNLDERVVSMRPHFCNIKDIPFVLLTIRLRNQLDVHGPRRILTVHDGLIQVLTGIVSVLTSSG